MTVSELLDSVELKKVFRREDGVVQRDIAGETLLIPVRGQLAALADIFALNPVGVYIWQQIDGQRDLGAILHALIGEFSVEPAEAHADLLGYIQELRSAGLIIETTDEPESDSEPVSEAAPDPAEDNK